METRELSVLALPTMDEQTGLLNVIIETPKGTRNKFGFDERFGLLRLKKVLPPSTVFPFNFGFLPSTWGEDGSPLDVVVLMEEPAFPGCLVSARLLGVIEAEQTRHGRKVRNDRFIAVADQTPALGHYQHLKDVEFGLLGQIEQFFISYNQAEGQKFIPIRRTPGEMARKLIAEGQARFVEKFDAR